MLKEITNGIKVDLERVSAVVESEEGGSVVYVDGVAFRSSLNFNNMVEAVEMAKKEGRKTTSDSKFVG